MARAWLFDRLNRQGLIVVEEAIASAHNLRLLIDTGLMRTVIDRRVASPWDSRPQTERSSASASMRVDSQPAVAVHKHPESLGRSVRSSAETWPRAARPFPAACQRYASTSGPMPPSPRVQSSRCALVLAPSSGCVSGSSSLGGPHRLRNERQSLPASLRRHRPLVASGRAWSCASRMLRRSMRALWPRRQFYARPWAEPLMGCLRHAGRCTFALSSPKARMPLLTEEEIAGIRRRLADGVRGGSVLLK